VPGSKRVIWLPEAISDLRRLRDFMRIHDPDAASRTANRILEGVRKLQMFPLLGRPVPNIHHPEVRDLFNPFAQGGYWLRYALAHEEIIVVRIWHTREEPFP